MELGDNPGDRFAGGIDLGGGVESSKGKSQTAPDAIIGESHGFEHMGGVDGSAGAGRSCRAANVFFVEQHENRFAVHPGEGDIGGVGQALVLVAIDDAVRHGAEKGAFE
jgi:hypothetical protein